MVGSCAVITQRFAGECTQENSARMLEQWLPLMGIATGHFQVLGGNAIADLAGLLHAARLNERTTIVHGFGNDGCARQCGKQLVYSRLNFVDVVGIWAQQNALRQLIVLGLRKQIHGHPLRRRCTIGQDQNFARACNHVNAYGAKHALFCAGHIGIARARYFVDFGNCGCAIGQSGHGLCAANGEGSRHTRHIGCGQHQRIFHALGRGDHHDDLFNTCHMRRDGVHQNGRGISGLAAWHINANTV